MPPSRSWEDDALTLYGSYQMPTADAQQLAKALGLPASKVRIVAPFIGGGFGSKLGHRARKRGGGDRGQAARVAR